ncbi:protease complex subunit PrcB family protein [Massilia horti]|uniref:Protease complex subunit PrcB family protein n=2 Tax=Massilia horti TaxID=2562153 RepID=A0A4Y9SRN0_9BURK|nr:protease complex subunit PrcB family protein [Massilia horti]
MAQARNCSDVKNRLFVIDGKQMFWDVAGNCGDASYSRVLFGGSPQEKLCSVGDSIAGPITRCEDEMSRALFDTIVKNLDNADLGLTGHKVEQVAFVPKAGTVIPSHNLVIAPISGVSDARQVVIKDAASFAKLWAEHGRNRTPAPPMPYVDFSRQMVLAVFAGQKPIPCYGLAINRAVSDGEKIVVEYDIFQLQTFVACAEVESAPMEMIVVDRNDVPVEFMRVRFGEVSFTNIDQTAHSGVTEPRAEVIKDIDSWTKLWAEHAGADAPVPMVNFSKQMVLGIFLGTQPNGCYSISIEHLYKSGNALSVIPYITMPGPDKVCTMLITTPAQLIALDRSDGEVKVTPIAVPVR